MCKVSKATLPMKPQTPRPRVLADLRPILTLRPYLGNGLKEAFHRSEEKQPIRMIYPPSLISPLVPMPVK